MAAYPSRAVPALRTYILERSSDFVIGTSKHFLQTWFIHRGCLIIIWTGLNIKIGIPQKVYEWPSCYFAKIFLQSQLGIILAKGQLDHSHIYFLNYANFILMPYPCSHFYFDIKFGDRLYSKENRLGSPLLFWIQSVAKFVIKVKVTTWIGH